MYLIFTTFTGYFVGRSTSVALSVAYHAAKIGILGNYCTHEATENASIPCFSALESHWIQC